MKFLFSGSKTAAAHFLKGGVFSLPNSQLFVSQLCDVANHGCDLSRGKAGVAAVEEVRRGTSTAKCRLYPCRTRVSDYAAINTKTHPHWLTDLET